MCIQVHEKAAKPRRHVLSIEYQKGKSWERAPSFASAPMFSSPFHSSAIDYLETCRSRPGSHLGITEIHWFINHGPSKALPCCARAPGTLALPMLPLGLEKDGVLF
jgi:hypothetical protein